MVLFITVNVFLFSEEFIIDPNQVGDNRTSEELVVASDKATGDGINFLDISKPKVLNIAEKVEIYKEKQIFFNKDIISYEILGAFTEKEIKIEKKLPNLYLIKGEKRGEYQIDFINKFGEVTVLDIEVAGKNYSKEEINKLFKEKTIYEGIKELYLLSEDVVNSQRLVYEFLEQKSKEKENIDFILDVFLISKMFLKNFEHEQKEFLERIYINKKTIGDIRAEIFILQLLKEYDKTYTLIHGEKALETGINEKIALIDLEKLVNENLNKEAARTLGLYYSKNNIKKAEKYLYIGDKREFFSYLLENEMEDKYTYYYNKSTLDEKMEVDLIKDEYKKNQIIKLYLKKGKLNIEEERYDVAKEYYNKVIQVSQKENIIKAALFNLGKIYINEGNYEKALILFDDYLKRYDSVEEVEALFYLGLSNFKLKNLEKSDIIFNQIKKTYKYSIWDEKIKNLLKEI